MVREDTAALTALRVSQPKKKATEVARDRARRYRSRPAPRGQGARATVGSSIHQFLDLSTSLLALIQGIIARSFSPTTSIGCSAVRRRRDSSVGAPARFSRMKLLA